MSAVAEDVAAALELAVEVDDDPGWPLRQSRAVATARSRSDAPVVGFGTGETAHEARRRAVFECAERLAQFEPRAVSTVAATARSLGEAALEPPSLGLYSRAQYSASGFGLAPFDPDAVLDWVEVTDGLAGATRSVPVEFVHPRAAIDRPPLVAETSSGTAAHGDWDAALLAALLEVVERDAAMLFWYRQPRTAVVPVEALPDDNLRDELAAVQRLGFVVSVCRLVNELGIPCYLVLALRGERFAYGLGSGLGPADALAHAVRELGGRLRWVVTTSPATELAHLSLADVETPADHYALYDAGPFHEVLRQYLAATLHADDDGDRTAVAPELAAEASLPAALAVLGRRGLRAWACELPVPGEAAGIRVARVLVPGLIPIHFGHDRLRLGCARLTGAGAPGRLSTLLPHCFG